MKKEFVVSLIISLIIFLSSGIFAIGEECFITDRNSCETNGNVIMGLSSTTNAHGELANQNNYDDVLCCNFAGSLTCDGQNKIIGLSSETNAHVEIPDETTYSTELCYYDLDCMSTSLNCEDITEKTYMPIFSLSNFTNAHIGEIDDYDIKICCTSESFAASSLNIYWSDDGINKISNLDVITGTTSVKMVLKNSGLAQGTIVNFNIYEDDLFLDDYIKTVTAVIDINGEATAEWTIILEDLEKTLNDYGELFFEANNQVSDYLTLNLLEVSECQSIILCSDYENENSCINNNCQIAETGAPSDVDCNDPTISCYCSWNAQCDFEFELEEGNVTVGTCTFVESTNDDCSDGFLSYSWIATWNDALETQPAECSDGSRVIECPAQIQLPFFGVYNLIATIILIAIIYLIIILRKKKILKLKKFLKKFY